ncbi:hypothetical protein IJV79_04000 [bacterium]|nr:hypothetical protein [bacterium]
MTYSYNTTYQNLLASPYQGFYAVPSAPAKVATDVVAATNATVNQEASCFSGVGLVAGISAIPELSTLRTYAKSTGTTTAQLFKTAGSTAVKDFSAIKDIFKSGNIVEGFKNLSKTNMTAQEAVRETVKTAKAAKKAAKAGKAAVDATEAVNATAKATTETVKTVTKGSKLLKAVKGNALLVAIEG